MFWSIFKVTLVIVIILAPIFYLNRRDWLPQKGAGDEARSVEFERTVGLFTVLRIVPVLALFMLPVFFLSDAPYAFYAPDEAVIKLAFKHSGRRRVDCGEEELFRKAGEMFRRQLKDTRAVEMDIDLVSKCPRERFPVEVRLSVDGAVVIDKKYPPKGFRKDMASYIYERVTVRPGTHRVAMWMNDSGPEGNGVYEIEETVEIKAGEILLLRFDDTKKALVME